MMNQNLSSLTLQPQNTSTPSDSLQKLESSKLLNQKKDEYIEEIHSQKRKTHLKNKGLAAVNSLSSQLDNAKLQDDIFGQGLSLQEFITDCDKRTYKLEQINELVASLDSADLCRQYFGVIGIRKLLTTEPPPIQPVIDAEAIPRLIELLGREDEHQLQAEAAWAVSNLSSGTIEQSQKIVENGAIPTLIKLLRSPHHDMKLQAICPFINLAGESIKFRDEILQGGAISPLVEILDKAISDGDAEIIRTANWALRSLCRGKPLPPFEEIKEAIPVFVKVIMSQEDPEILKEAIWFMYDFSEGEKEERIQEVINTGVVPYIVKHMDKSDPSVLVGCLRNIRNICLGSDKQLDVVLGVPGVMERIFNALQSKKKTIRKDAACVISKIAAGTSDHIEYIVGNPQYLDLLFDAGINDIPEIRKEIAVAINNAIEIASKEQMGIFLEKKRLLVFFRLLLKEEEVSLQKIALAGIWMIWNLKEERAPEGFSKASCWALFEDNKILPVLEGLQKSPSSAIKKLTAQILGAGTVEK